MDIRDFSVGPERVLAPAGAYGSSVAEENAKRLSAVEAVLRHTLSQVVGKKSDERRYHLEVLGNLNFLQKRMVDIHFTKLDRSGPIHWSKEDWFAYKRNQYVEDLKKSFNVITPNGVISNYRYLQLGEMLFPCTTQHWRGETRSGLGTMTVETVDPKARATKAAEGIEAWDEYARVWDEIVYTDEIYPGSGPVYFVRQGYSSRPLTSYF